MTWRLALVGLTAINLVIGASLVAGQAAAKGAAAETVRARLIELVDEQGRVRAQLKVEPDGEAVLRLRNAKGEIRVKLAAGERGSGLVLLDPSTEPGVQMLAGSDGPSVSLTGRDGRRKVIAP
jgi:hypothetical protein